jgi:hypothetical protein
MVSLHESRWQAGNMASSEGMVMVGERSKTSSTVFLFDRQYHVSPWLRSSPTSHYSMATFKVEDYTLKASTGEVLNKKRQGQNDEPIA